MRHVEEPEPVVRPIPMAQVKALLEREQEERGELTYEQKLALEQGVTFARLDVETTEKLFKDLMEMERLSDAQRWKIVDLAPMHQDDVRAIFAKDRLGLEEAEIDRIIELVQGYIL